jgi:transcriptional regulator with XRE-family HTH domain
MKQLPNKYASPAYWTQLIQVMLYRHINSYLKDHHMTQKDFAAHLGVSKGYVSQVLSGDFDHKLSKLTELALACDLVPCFDFVPLQYAEQVAKTCYIQPTDWRACQSYAYETWFPRPQMTADAATFSKSSLAASIHVSMKDAVWLTPDTPNSTKIA